MWSLMTLKAPPFTEAAQPGAGTREPVCPCRRGASSSERGPGTGLRAARAPRDPPDRALIDDFHHIRCSTAPHRHALYAWVPPSPRVRCRTRGVCITLPIPYRTCSLPRAGHRLVVRCSPDTSRDKRAPHTSDLSHRAARIELKGDGETGDTGKAFGSQRASLRAKPLRRGDRRGSTRAQCWLRRGQLRCQATRPSRRRQGCPMGWAL